MPSLLEEIKQDLVSDVPISRIVRKAQILAYKLESTELRDWAAQELDGYSDHKALPDYRIFQGLPRGQLLDAFGGQKERQPISAALLPEAYRSVIDIRMTSGLGQLQAMIHTQEQRRAEFDAGALRWYWPPELVAYLNQTVYKTATFSCNAAWTEVSVGALEQVLESVGNRLLSFVLELERRYPDQIISGFPDSREELKQIVQTIILCGEITATTFNQQGQHMISQSNAGHDSHLGGVPPQSDSEP